MTAFLPPTNLRGSGDFRGPVERHIRSLQAAINAARTDLDDVIADLAADIALGYRYGGTLYFEQADDGENFVKADYPGLRAITVELQGPGGGGGGAAATAAGQISVGGGGGAGGYVKDFLLASALAASEALVIPAGGTGVSGGSGNSGANTTNFGGRYTVGGGQGASVLAAGNTDNIAGGGAGGSGSGGDVIVRGGHGEIGVRIAASVGRGGAGGGGSKLASYGIARGTTGDGLACDFSGGGGGGAVNGASQSARPGGNGGDARIVVHLHF